MHVFEESQLYFNFRKPLKIIKFLLGKVRSFRLHSAQGACDPQEAPSSLLCKQWQLLYAIHLIRENNPIKTNFVLLRHKNHYLIRLNLNFI